jgi:Rrf2 family protein
MNITLESDYAIRIVYCLAQNQRRMDAKQIAEQTGVTLRFSLKILRKLVGGGFIKSFKGIQGGYEMNKLPSEITVRQILELIEGEYNLNRCAAVDFICTHKKGGACKMRQVFEEVSQMVSDKLDSVTIQDLL